MGTLENRLLRHSVLGLDTSVFIYHLEAHPRYLPAVRTVLSGVRSFAWRAITSAITII